MPDTGFVLSEPLSGNAAATVTMDHAEGLTAMGAFIGTVGYVPPEHANFQGDTSTVADVYSLGAVLYKLLTGKTTFKAKDADDALRQLRECDPPTPRSLNPAIDPRLEAICLKCLQKDPQFRYASAEALAQDLDRWLNGEPPLAWEMPWRLRAWRGVRRNLLTVVGSSLVSVAAATMFFVYYYFDPDRIPRQIENESKQGRVTLIGETGPPRWSRWNVGEGTAVVAAEKDEAYSFTTVEHARIELLRRAPGPRYRFSAEVRHEKVLNFAGFAGIYFGHTRQETKDDVERYWCDLTFADQGGLATGEAGPGPQRNFALVEFKLALHSLPTRYTTRKTGVQQPFLSAREMKETSNWRKLAIEVTPEKVSTFWEGKPLQERSLAELRQLCRGKIVGGEVKAPQFEFDLDGGLGLYVFQGKAFFRRVTIEPLD